MDLPATFGKRKVLPLLLQFARRHPRLQPRVTFTDRFVDLAEEGIDLAVRIGGPDRRMPGLSHRQLGVERLVFCAAPDYLDRRGAPKDVDELSRHDAVAYARADGAAAWRVPLGEMPPAGLAAAMGSMPIEGAITLGDAEAQLDAVIAGCASPSWRPGWPATPCATAAWSRCCPAGKRRACRCDWSGRPAGNCCRRWTRRWKCWGRG